MCLVWPAISIRGLIGSRTNKQYNGVGRDVLSREGQGVGGAVGPDCHLSPGAGCYGDK